MPRLSNLLCWILPVLLCHCRTPISPSLTPQSNPIPSASVATGSTTTASVRRAEARTYPAYPTYPASPELASDSAWRPTSRSSPEALHPAAFYHQVRLGLPTNSIDLDVIIFDSRQLRLAVIDQPNDRAGGNAIAGLLRSRNAIAGVNGGFFSPDFKPLGLSISQGSLLSSFTNSKLIAGTVLQLDHQPYLIWNSEYQGPSSISEALQAGPRLIDSRRPIAGLDSSKSRARTFVATDGSFLWAIGTTSSCSLASLAEALTSPGALPGLKPMRALNLDGGNSTALWIRHSTGKETSRPGWSTVRNYLAIIPK